jgi:hypothetical protein
MRNSVSDLSKLPDTYNPIKIFRRDRHEIRVNGFKFSWELWSKNAREILECIDLKVCVLPQQSKFNWNIK